MTSLAYLPGQCRVCHDWPAHTVCEDQLLRIKHTPAQHTLKRTQRLSILADAFSPESLLARQLIGRRLVLVDVIMTTGASLHAAALVLRAGDVASMSALVIARTD